MERQLENKVALITGASSGIGRAAALLFAREGARLVLADVDVAGGEETAQMVTDKGGEAIFVRTDVSQAAQVEALVQRGVGEY
ncbi:MAG: SDR family NAD(P)-dependent oxidoreductase, partial [Anaerolineales bacterium]|nr:SDR family NAD(P)-dependent oxidoreductase [Anaerolineales bacterium]